MDLLSVRDAAQDLSVHESRVRAMLAAGQLEGDKLGGRWVVPRASVQEYRRLRAPAGGRPLQPSNAWAVLALASGVAAPNIGAREARRLAKLLARQGLCALAPRLRRRAAVHRYRAHPGVLRELAQEPPLHAAGISAAREAGLGLLAGDEVDAYVSNNELADVVREFALEEVGPSDPSGNVVLRAVEPSVAASVFAGSAVPFAAVALDVAEQADRRSARIGSHALRQLDRERRWAEGESAMAAAELA
jgi:excisionase family DNA binding protein